MASSRMTSPTPPVKSRHNSGGTTARPPVETIDYGLSGERPVQDSAETGSRPAPGSSNATNSGIKVPRGYSGRMLETVEEGDQPVSPQPELSNSLASLPDAAPMTPLEHVVTDSSNIDTSDTISLTSIEGGDQNPRSDSAERAAALKKTDSRRDSSSTVRKAYTSLIPSKVRSNNDASAKNMTVETETVASIPTTIIPSAVERTAGRDNSGTLRKMASVETIKPKKKKFVKKPPSIISGTSSSKADIFEAKVASAVDEDESDSDETFVYESNPPEPRHRQNRHHSRTPSATSMQSFRDRRTSARPAGNLLDNQRKVRGKRSMKFVSNSYAGSQEGESGDNDQGTVRASNNRRSGGGSAFLASELYGPNVDNDAPRYEESLFSQPTRSRNAQNNNSRHSSKAELVPSPIYYRSPSRKGPSSPYEFGGEGERTPLMGSMRGQRLRGSRRQHQTSGMRHLDYYPEDHSDRGIAARLASFVLMPLVVLLAVMGAATFLFATSKALYDVKVFQIQNVLASEQEIMLDLLVEAFNPNIVGITVAEMDVNVFARSRYLNDDVLDNGTTELHARRLRWLGTHDHGTDPMPDPTFDPQTMLLGRVFDFDSGLYFEGSPLRRLAHNSTGEFRLPWPGNGTELGGHEKWEKVLKHRFELIVRGILKYQLPLSSKTMTVGINANVTVNGSSGGLDTEADDDVPLVGITK